MYIRDTIAAISTPVGEGGIAVIRVSGPQAPTIAAAIFRKNSDGGFKSHRFYYGRIIDPASGEHLDEAMAVLMCKPNSFTREDVFEIQCHGGYLVVQSILSLVLRYGARLAEAGEFTKRAFLNGRIDLVQAEAVMDVTRSKSDMSLKLAQHQREGFLSQRLALIKEDILSSLAILEAFIDFPEEDIDPAAAERIKNNVQSSLHRLDDLLSGFSEGKVIREGVSVVIAGRPNVGKSSLLNALLKDKRAIVTSIPGTTRDLIEEQMTIKGLPVKLLDTAGIRESEDQVEQEGVRRCLQKISSADLVLFVIDSSQPFEEEDRQILQMLSGSKYLVVKNKSDIDGGHLYDLPTDVAVIPISTSTGFGLEVLQETLFQMFMHNQCADSREYVAISQARHRDALTACRAAVDRFVSGLDSGFNFDLLAIDLRDALFALGQVTGETTADDVLDRIFSTFCIGK